MKKEDIIISDDDCEVTSVDENISSLIPKLPNDEEFSLLAGFFSVFQTLPD